MLQTLFPFLTQRRLGGLLLFGALVLAISVAACRRGTTPTEPEPAPPRDVTREVHRFCGDCHAYPPAETFPRAHWKDEVERGYSFAGQSGRVFNAPPIESVIEYYEQRAPLDFEPPHFEGPPYPLPVSFQRQDLGVPARITSAAASNVSLVHLLDEHRPDILVCEMRAGQVLVYQPYLSRPTWKVLGRVSNPAHAEVVDLDRDGVKDVLVANLGSFTPTDAAVGSVVWLRGRKDGSFTSITLLENVGRVADVQAADFNGDGKTDLIVAVFGWNRIGSIVYLENKTTDWGHPHFVPHTIDERHGAIHVPVVDLNGDNKPDFIALISQEHEAVVAFLNDGKGGFKPHTLWAASHPGYGSSGIQLVDMDKDGDLDILYTNGDVLDKPYLLKPYHSIQWLENRGNLKFVHHPLTSMYGVHRAVAADLDKDGDLDIVAVSFLPEEGFPQRKRLNLPALIVLEQTEKGKFVRHVLETGTCDHVSCTVGDVFGTGRMDILTGSFAADERTPTMVSIRKNEGASRP